MIAESTPKSILKMIETVDPADTAKLDEIDARVAEYTQDRDCEDPHIFQDYLDFLKHGFDVPFFTRSRDALKAIRPKGWNYRISESDTHKFWCELREGYETSYDKVVIGKAATEEIAELHAIIQAIEYERRETLRS